jgi:hypothetical protein
LERIGAKFEGFCGRTVWLPILFPATHFDFLRTEWPEVKEKLEKLLKRI